MLVSVEAAGADRVAVIGPDQVVYSDKPPFGATIQIPSNTVGIIHVGAVAFIGDAYASMTPLSLIVKPLADIHEILVEPMQLYLQSGETLALSTQGYFGDGITRTLASGSGVTYSSSNGSTVSVDADGIVTAGAPGNAEITITFAGQRVIVPAFVTSTDSGRHRAVRH